MPGIQIKRIYEQPDPKDGIRILVDRVWPRGVSKEKAALDRWMKDISPSPELRKWFNHDPGRFERFKEEYEKELANDEEKMELAETVKEQALYQQITLIFSAKDECHNHAIVLRDWLNR
ncbi:DUF488 domain-containing protein [Bacillus marinisedimentorum]|uniref:DUF488 domain-containing protein n=1 Tax=Bacillus marinisedimentorum TaxID=1821260 RepID=UPI0008732A07|nr:DUF488 domain-containing protein [Bacillus marinisedimentorum]